MNKAKAARSPVHEKRCLECLSDFLSSRSDARFCTDACRTNAHRAKTGIRAATDLRQQLKLAMERVEWLQRLVAEEEAADEWSSNT